MQKPTDICQPELEPNIVEGSCGKNDGVAKMAAKKLQPIAMIIARVGFNYFPSVWMQINPLFPPRTNLSCGILNQEPIFLTPNTNTFRPGYKCVIHNRSYRCVVSRPFFSVGRLSFFSRLTCSLASSTDIGSPNRYCVNTFMTSTSLVHPAIAK